MKEIEIQCWINFKTLRSFRDTCFLYYCKRGLLVNSGVDVIQSALQDSLHLFDFGVEGRCFRIGLLFFFLKQYTKTWEGIIFHLLIVQVHKSIFSTGLYNYMIFKRSSENINLINL